MFPEMYMVEVFAFFHLLHVQFMNIALGNLVRGYMLLFPYKILIFKPGIQYFPDSYEKAQLCALASPCCSPGNLELLSRRVIQDDIHGIGNYFCQAN